MKSLVARPAVRWVVIPLLLATAGALAGNARARAERGVFFGATAALADRERAALEVSPLSAVTNATWAFGTVSWVKKAIRNELDHRPESAAARRARAFIRFAIVDSNPDGQAALFATACATDASVCEQDALRAATERETRLRFVAPGNRLPLFVLGGHPPIPALDTSASPPTSAHPPPATGPELPPGSSP